MKTGGIWEKDQEIAPLVKFGKKIITRLTVQLVFCSLATQEFGLSLFLLLLSSLIVVSLVLMMY